MSLIIYDKNETAKTQVSEFEFHDTFMGEQYVILTVKSPVRIEWEIGDYVEYRGEIFTLNYIPSCIQSSSVGENGDAFTYEQVKFNSYADELTRCSFRDITPTNNQYDTKEGTNYTGSTTFTLHCGQTVFGHYEGTDWVDDILTPVTYLAGVIQSNLNEMYGAGVWTITVNQETTQTDSFNIEASQWTCLQALEQVYATFKLNYAVRGRNIEIGCDLQNITGDEGEGFVFGYGKGYAKQGNDDKSLIKIERTADSSQQIITRLRVTGSKKNMPYRYYHEKYGSIPQTMFIQSLQLPDTFLPYGDASTQNTKAYNNAQRGSSYLHVLGPSNDAYIEKENDAENTEEGVREGFVAFDGSGDLDEIYPTIKEVVYNELRVRNIPDIDENTGISSYPNYLNDERIDEVLNIKDEETNVGSGVMTVSEVIGEENRNTVALPGDADYIGSYVDYSVGEYTQRIGEKFEVLRCSVVRDGTYIMSCVLGGAYLQGMIWTEFQYVHYIGFQVSAYIVSTSGVERFVHTESFGKTINKTVKLTSSDTYDLNGILTKFPSMKIKAGESVVLYVRGDLYSTPDTIYGSPRVIYRKNETVKDNNFSIIVAPATQEFINSPFTIYLKDMGFNLSDAITEGEDPKIIFNSGWCGGREFALQSATADYTEDGKKGWTVTVKSRIADDSINAYFPNENYPIMPGDRFVLTGIAMPQSYIEVAELRLLTAAMDYLADNSETKFTYKPSISRVYLKENYDANVSAGTEEKAILYNLYAGYKFSMYARSPKEGSAELIDNITIQNVTIYERKDGPEVDIVLNDNTEQSSYQKLVTQVDRIYGSMFGGNRTGSSSSVNYDTLFSLIVNKAKQLFLSKIDNDIASGIIGFMNGLWVKAEGLFGFSAEGDVTARTLKATGTDGRATEESDKIKNVGLEVTESGIIGGMLKVAKKIYTRTIESLNFTGGSTPSGTGWQLTDDDGTGHSKLTVDNLYVRVKAVFEELEVKKWSVTGGNHLFSSAANVVVRTDYYNENGAILGYSTYIVPWLLRKVPLLAGLVGTTSVAAKILGVRKTVRMSLTNAESIAKIRCYFYAKDDETEVENWWKTGDLAYCKEMNVSQSKRRTYINTVEAKSGNVVWWRRVVGVSTTPVMIGDKSYHYFDVSMSDCMEDSDIPCAGDDVVQLGNVSDPDRMNAISIEVSGTDAPCMKAYRGIYTYTLEKSWWGGSAQKMKLSPATGYEFYGPQFKQVTEYGVKPVPNQLGEWDDLVNDENCRDDFAPHANVHKCHYYDQVTHNGSTWLCVITDELHWRVEPVEGEVVTIIYGGVTYSEGDALVNDEGDSIYELLPDEDKAKCQRVRDYTTEEPSSSSQDWLCTVEKGDAGTSPLILDLDNQADEFGTDSESTVLVQQVRKTTATMYVGTTPQTLTNLTATLYYEDGTAVPAAVATVVPTLASGLVVVTINQGTFSADGMYAEIEATCEVDSRTARFSLHKVKSGAKGENPVIYQLALSQKSLSYGYDANNNIVAINKSVKANVKVTEGNNSVIHSSTFTGAPTVKWGFDDSTTAQEENKAVGYTITLEAANVGTHKKIWVQLSTGDKEEIPIVRDGMNGAAGESPIVMTIDNEMDGVPCNSEGHVTYTTTIVTAVRLKEGASVVEEVTAPAKRDIPLAGITPTDIDNTNGVVTITWNITANTQITNGRTTVDIPLAYDGVTYTKTFTLNAVKSGAIYNLALSTTDVSFARNDSTNTLTPASVDVTCFYTKNTGSSITRTQLTTHSNDYDIEGTYNIFYRACNANGTYGNWTLWRSLTNCTLPIASSTTLTGYEVVISSATAGTGVANANIIDIQTISINKDGLNGDVITKGTETYRYATNNTGVRPAADSTAWSGTKPTTLLKGYWLYTETTIPWSNGTTTVLYTDERNPNDGNAGQDIVVDGSTVITYCVSDTNTTQPDDSSFEPYSDITIVKGKWLWSRAVTYYRKASSSSGAHDAGSSSNYTVSYIPNDGNPGRSVTAVTEYYKATNSNTAMSVPENDTGWDTDPNLSHLTDKWNKDHIYLWNYEKVEYSSGTTPVRTTPQILAIWTKDGKGIDAITNYYKITNSTRVPLRTHEGGTGWDDDPMAPTPSNQYLWNYEVITYTEGDPTYTEVQMIGHYGRDGESSLILDLDNQADEFGTDSENVVLVEQVRSTGATMYYGTQEQELTGLTAALYYEDGTAVPSTVAEAARKTGTDIIEVTIKQGTFSASGMYAEVTATCAMDSKTARFSLQKVKSGAKGENPVIYQLSLSQKSLSYGYDSNNALIAISNKVKVNVKVTEGNDSEIKTSTFTGAPTISWGYSGSETPQSSGLAVGTEITITASNVGNNSGIWVALSTGDTEDIPFVKNGLNGGTGSAGRGTVQIFKWNATRPDVPISLAYEPAESTGWYKYAPARPTTSTETYLWMSTGVLVSGSNVIEGSSWSTPVRISGEKGQAGDDGTDMEYIYMLRTADTTFDGQGTNPAHPKDIDTPSSTSTGQTKADDDFVPQGWSDDAQSISQTNKYEYISFRIKPKGSSTWGDFQDPIIWSHWGRNGMDGAGVEYVFMRSKNVDSNGEPIAPILDSTQSGYNVDEFKPNITAASKTNCDAESYICTDDPTGVDGTFKYEWVAKRIKGAADSTTGEREWGKFGSAENDWKMSLWAKYANDGANSVRLDLDNEMDSILYQGDGTTKISGNVVTNIRLYDGAEDKTSTLTSSTLVVSNTTLSASQYTLDETAKTLTVSGLTNTTETVVVRATYKGAYYYATMTIKKLVGTDKFDLDITPNAIAHNTSTSWGSNKTITIRVMRTPANGGTPTAVNISDYQNYGLAISNDVNNNPLSGSGTDNTFTVTNAIFSANSGITFTLHKSTDSSSVYDRETIPFNKTANGTNVCRLDLSNEMDMVLTDSEDYVAENRNVVTIARFFDGATEITLGENSLSFTEGLTPRWNEADPNSDGRKLTWTFYGGRSSQFTGFDCEVSYVHTDGVTYRSTITILGSKGQAIYQLKPDMSSIPFTRNSSGAFIDNSVNVSLSIIRIERNETTELTSLDSSSPVIVRYSLSSMPTTSTSGTSWTSGTISVSNTDTNLYIAMFNTDGVLLDRETIPVVKDGARGNDAPSVGENIINGNKNPHTYTLNSETHYQTDRTYDASDMPADGEKMSGQARITLSGCTIESSSKIFLYIQSYEENVGYGRLIFAEITNPTNTTFDASIDNITVDSDGVAWDEIVRVGIEGITGGTITVERVKLEVGSVCTAYCLSAEDTIGGQGENGVAVELTASSVLLTQDIDTGSIDYTDAYTDVYVMDGETSVDASDFTITSATPTHCSIRSDYNSTKRIKIEAILAKDGMPYYHNSGYVDITVVYNGHTYNKRFFFYCNTLGEWSDSIKGDTKTEVAQSIQYALNGVDCGYEGINNLGTYVRSSTKAISRIDQAVHTVGNRNYFGFHRDLTFTNCMPAIQSYGVLLTQSSSPTIGGFNLAAGTYTLSFKIKSVSSYISSLSITFTGSSTSTKSTSVSTSWSEVKLTYTTSFNISSIVFGSVSQNVLIRDIKIEKGSEQTEFRVADEDMSYMNPSSLIAGSSWTRTNTEESNVTSPSGKQVYETTSMPASGSITNFVQKSGLSLNAGEIYTLSFFAKADTDGLGMYSCLEPLYSESISQSFFSPTESGEQGEIVQRNGGTKILLTADWKKYYVHWYVSESGSLTCTAMRVDNSSSSYTGTIYFSDVQFVEGYIDEVNESVSRSFSEIEQTAKGITLRVNENEENISSLSLTSESLVASVSEIKDGKNKLSGSLTGSGWYKGSIDTTSRKLTLMSSGVSVDKNMWMSVSSGYNSIITSSVTLTSGKKYTLSFDSNGISTVSVYRYSASTLPAAIILVGTAYLYGDGRNVLTFTASSSSSVRFIIYKTPIRYVQLEAGETHTEYEASGNEISSAITMTAETISAKVTDGLTETGIDIVHNTVTVQADNFVVNNNANVQVLGTNADGDLEVTGTIRANNFYHGTCIYGYDSNPSYYCKSLTAYETESWVSNFEVGKYYTLEQFRTLSGTSDEPDGNSFVYCSGTADIIILANTYNTSGDRSINVPSPQHFQGKMIEVVDNAYNNSSSVGDIVIQTVLSETVFTSGIYMQSGNPTVFQALAQPRYTHGTQIRLLSICVDGVYYWMSITKPSNAQTFII